MGEILTTFLFGIIHILFFLFLKKIGPIQSSIVSILGRNENFMENYLLPVKSLPPCRVILIRIKRYDYDLLSESVYTYGCKVFKTSPLRGHRACLKVM
jgi:hypothetical protein